jgi:hypothetical protein
MRDDVILGQCRHNGRTLVDRLARTRPTSGRRFHHVPGVKLQMAVGV